MVFYGFQKTTLIDYPGEIASLVFTGGCNFCCPYCYNPELVNTQSIPQHSEDEIIAHLKKQKGKIEALCISGGEPLLYREQLLEFIDKVKSLDIKIKLDTNGSLPQWLKKANVDYIAMDIKTSAEKYPQVFNKNENHDEMLAKISESINYITASGIDYEFRTTIAPNLVTISDIEYIAKHFIPGAKRYFLNQFRPQITLDENYGILEPYSDIVLQEMANICKKYNVNCNVRSGYSTEGTQHKF